METISRPRVGLGLKLVFAFSVMAIAPVALAQGRPLTIDDVMRGAVQQKEMRRQGAAQPNLPMDSSGMIDVNRIPDPYTAPANAQPAPNVPRCQWTRVDNSGTLYGTGGIGNPITTVCMCGLQHADPGNCR